MKASKYVIRTGVGISNGNNRLPSFDKALIEAGVGNYNLVRLSSILPANCVMIDNINLEEGSLLPTAYATITSDKEGDFLVSCIGIGFPKDHEKVGVIMEYSGANISVLDGKQIIRNMIQEAFDARGWELEKVAQAEAWRRVGKGETVSTFACVAEW